MGNFLLGVWILLNFKTVVKTNICLVFFRAYFDAFPMYDKKFTLSSWNDQLSHWISNFDYVNCEWKYLKSLSEVVSLHVRHKLASRGRRPKTSSSFLKKALSLYPVLTGAGNLNESTRTRFRCSTTNLGLQKNETSEKSMNDLQTSIRSKIHDWSR